MREYKIVELRPNEYDNLVNSINQIRHSVSDGFKVSHPDWSTQKESYSEEEQNAILEETFYEPMRKRILELQPGLRFGDHPPDRWSLDPIRFLEAKLNEFANEGWELDRLRLLQPTSYNNGILIFRRNVSTD